jgi:hypothetical protein
MKLKNFTDLNAWAVEQWGDTELGDSRRTDRAMSTTGYSASQWEQQLPPTSKQVCQILCQVGMKSD